MSKLKDYVKATTLYNHTFFLRHLKESLARHVRRRSFAEYGEDLMVEKLLGKKVEYFIDVGANDGFHSSNSFYFALRGARGVCFEPIPENYARLRSLHRFNSRVTCLCCGISDANQHARMVALEALSYLPETQDVRHRQLHRSEHAGPQAIRETVLFRFPDAIAGLDVPQDIDLLSVDVEGHELNVLRSIPFDRYRFRVIIVETHQLGADGQYLWKHRDYEEIFHLLALWGYLPAQRTTANTIFVMQESAPPRRVLTAAAAVAGP